MSMNATTMERTFNGPRTFWVFTDFFRPGISATYFMGQVYEEITLWSNFCNSIRVRNDNRFRVASRKFDDDADLIYFELVDCIDQTSRCIVSEVLFKHLDDFNRTGYLMHTSRSYMPMSLFPLPPPESPEYGSSSVEVNTSLNGGGLSKEQSAGSKSSSDVGELLDSATYAELLRRLYNSSVDD